MVVVPITKKILVIFLLVLATAVVSSNAAQRARFVTASPAQDGQNYEELPTKIFDEEEGKTVNRVDRRMQMMNTDDYDRYNPSPSLSKPRYKLIPN